MARFGIRVNGFSQAVGTLRDIRTGWTSGGGRWIVGVGAEYGAYVEFGTSRMSAQPYFFPAAREALSQDLPRILSRAKRVRQPLEYIISRLALAIEERAKRKAPVDTGFLQNSIVAAPAPKFEKALQSAMGELAQPL